MAELLESTYFTIPTDSAVQSLVWQEEQLIDWVSGGNRYDLSGNCEDGIVSYGDQFDAAIQSKDGVYVVIYAKLGTKALVLKNGKLIRELNRSFYQADMYEYPIAFLKLPSGRNCIIHCPHAYNLIEIEDAETGKRITNCDEKKADDCFHSRFRVSPSNTVLLNLGWIWHPLGILEIYDIAKGLENNEIFEKVTRRFPVNTEICSADFLDDNFIVMSSTIEEEVLDEDKAKDPELLQDGQIGLFSIADNKFVKKITSETVSGALVAINQDFVLSLYDYPKVYDLNTGIIVKEFRNINTGQQDSAIIHHINKIPPIAIRRKKEQLSVTIGADSSIEVLTFSLNP